MRRRCFKVWHFLLALSWVGLAWAQSDRGALDVAQMPRFERVPLWSYLETFPDEHGALTVQDARARLEARLEEARVPVSFHGCDAGYSDLFTTQWGETARPPAHSRTPPGRRHGSARTAEPGIRAGQGAVQVLR